MRVMHARIHRHARPRRLRQPPQAPHPWMARSHHALADKIHHQWAHLRRRIHRIRVRKRPQHRISFHAVTARNRSSRRPRVKHRRAAACNRQRIPQFPLRRRFRPALNRDLHAAKRRTRYRSRHDARLNLRILSNLGFRRQRQRRRLREGSVAVGRLAESADSADIVIAAGMFSTALAVPSICGTGHSNKIVANNIWDLLSDAASMPVGQRYMPSTTELYCAEVQVALAPWSHLWWYSPVGFWFEESGTCVLAPNIAGSHQLGRAALLRPIAGRYRHLARHASQ